MSEERESMTGTEMQTYRLDLLDESVGPDDVLKILQQAIVVLSESLGLHHRNLLDFSLQNEKSVVVQIDAVTAKKLANIIVRRRFPVNSVFRRVVLVACACHDEFTARNDLVVIVRLLVIVDKLEVDRHASILEVWMTRRVVNQLRHLILSQVLRSLAKYEEQSIDHV
jgi:hypothetical protein